MRGPMLTVELINRCFLDKYSYNGAFKPCAAGRITNSCDLFVGLYLHVSQLRKVGGAETFESWPSEKGANSK